MEYKDYYASLGVPRTATQDDIKHAYRKLARKYHPDVSKEADAEARFKEMGEAYKVLKDPETRAAYDQVGNQWKNGQEFQPPPNWDAGFEFSGRDAGAGADYSDFFEALFGRQAGRGHASRQSMHAPGQDHHAKVQIDLGDAYHGAQRSISLRLPVMDAQGRVVTQERTLDITIPKGIREGQHLRLSGQGGPGLGGGPAGDLYLEIAFRPHPHYRVDGRDVYFDLPLAPWEAALGGSITAPTPEGSVHLTIPPGSSAGRKLRLKGQGIPGSPAGDLYAVLTIALPPADNERAKEAYRAMAQAFDFNPRAHLHL
ncbi:DnaJ C-terminal domain-containing protein [Herminiimonas sp. CN]|uniref:DnaJ C-terminal domain-containing protein n=1 Tax=Herminiimonas sp. CN TaxID=1349818 RepID=UPI000473018A|nr:DnaJ C-terminal domain-containing protein [Herminiimonas sp. CN]